MNENGYKIMHVSDGTDSTYGNLKSATIIQYTIKGRFMSR